MSPDYARRVAVEAHRDLCQCAGAIDDCRGYREHLEADGNESGNSDAEAVEAPASSGR